jgi:TRAP-type C4-dicarboxylate transport system permease small subunit
MTNIYLKFVHGLVRVMRFVSGAAIMMMLSLTCADIVLRFFRRPIPGVYDLVSFLGAIAVSFAIAHNSLENGHVAVEFVVAKLPERIRAGVRSMVNFLGLLLFVAISWQSFLYANDLRASGEISPTIQLPYYPVVYGISFATGAVCLVLFAALAENLAKVRKK